LNNKIGVCPGIGIVLWVRYPVFWTIDLHCRDVTQGLEYGNFSGLPNTSKCEQNAAKVILFYGPIAMVSFAGLFQ